MSDTDTAPETAGPSADSPSPAAEDTSRDNTSRTALIPAVVAGAVAGLILSLIVVFFFSDGRDDEAAALAQQQAERISQLEARLTAQADRLADLQTKLDADEAGQTQNADGFITAEDLTGMRTALEDRSVALSGDLQQLVSAQAEAQLAMTASLTTVRDEIADLSASDRETTSTVQTLSNQLAEAENELAETRASADALAVRQDAVEAGIRSAARNIQHAVREQIAAAGLAESIRSGAPLRTALAGLPEALSAPVAEITATLSPRADVALATPAELLTYADRMDAALAQQAQTEAAAEGGAGALMGWLSSSVSVEKDGEVLMGGAGTATNELRAALQAGDTAAALSLTGTFDPATDGLSELTDALHLIRARTEAAAGLDAWLQAQQNGTGE